MMHEKRTVKGVLLFNYGIVIPVMVSLVAAVIFTLWPDALNHSPISFEQRGIIHHIWHYTLLFGSMVALYGVFSNHKRRIYIELLGQVAIVLTIALNLVAQASVLIEKGQELAVLEGITGWGITLRAGVMLVLAFRCYILLSDPHITVIALARDRIEVEDDKEWPT